MILIWLIYKAIYSIIVVKLLSYFVTQSSAHRSMSYIFSLVSPLSFWTFSLLNNYHYLCITSIHILFDCSAPLLFWSTLCPISIHQIHATSISACAPVCPNIAQLCEAPGNSLAKCEHAVIPSLNFSSSSLYLLSCCFSLMFMRLL